MVDKFTSEPPGDFAGNQRVRRSTDLVDAAARVFRLGGQWYFSTRDGDIGPYRTREQAKREALAHHTVLTTR